MKRKLPLSLPAVLAAALLPGLAFVGCKSTEVADTDAVSETTGAAADPAVEIVRPASVDPLDKQEGGTATDVVEAPGDVEKKKFRLFGLGGKKEKDAAAVVDAEAVVEDEPAMEEPRGRKPLFGRKSKEKDDPEIAAVKEKKKFQLFGFGRKKDQDAEEVVPEDTALASADGSAEEEIDPIEEGPNRLPWEDSEPEIAAAVSEDLPEPGTFPSFPESGGASASGVTARIRPGESSGGFNPLDETPAAASSVLDRVPSITDEPARPSRVDDDGFVPLTPEPKFPGEEGILPPGS